MRKKCQKEEGTKEKGSKLLVVVFFLRSSGRGLYLVKEIRAEWCWMSGIERWRGCGRDRAPGGEKARRASLRE